MDQAEPLPSPARVWYQRRPWRSRPTARPQAPGRPLPVPHDLVSPVVAGYDGSAAARNALVYAAGLARRLRRPLLVAYVDSRRVYCAPLSGLVMVVPYDADGQERWLLAELDQVADVSGLSVHVRSLRGQAARELAAVAARLRADALVIGAPRCWWHRLAGSVPARLTRSACCPVITVP